MRKEAAQTMEVANLTINGRSVSAPIGSTILQAAQNAGIDIPTLCDHPAVTPIGACRMCLVEVEGQRTLVTACTFPIAEGMIVQTESPQVVNARKLVLELLFSERNHVCPSCESSGSCELQDLGYRFGIDHWKYSTIIKRFPVDGSHKYLLFDHNRCVLCGRCERGCGELVANHTLGLRNRGSESMIHCDAMLPWGSSTCISCGTCLQVCPTGAISDKRSAFMGRDAETEHIKSTCSQCSVGCGIEIVTRSNNVLRIDGDWDTAVSGGRLCEHGRFAPLFDERTRIMTPLIKVGSGQPAVSWKEALSAVKDRLDGVGADDIGVVTTTNATNESLYLLSRIFKDDLKVSNVGMMNAVVPKLSGTSNGSLQDIVQGDIIIVAGVDPVNDQPVASFFVKRAIDKGARLIVVDDRANGLAPFAYKNLGMSDVDLAVEIAGEAASSVVLYGTGLSKKAVQALEKLGEKARFIPLEPGVNTYAAEVFGFNNGFSPSSAKVLYAQLGEEKVDEESLLKQIDENATIIVQASYESPLTQRADIVLPMAVWSERTGSLTNTEGRVQHVSQAVKHGGEAKPDWEILSLMAETLEGTPGISLEELSTLANQKIGHKEK
jgi:formate dehydrogenase major subunit